MNLGEHGFRIGISGLKSNDVYVVVNNTTDNTVTLADGVAVGTKTKSSADDEKLNAHMSALSEQMNFVKNLAQTQNRKTIQAATTNAYVPVDYALGSYKTWINSSYSFENGKPIPTFNATLKNKATLSNGGKVYLWVDERYPLISQAALDYLVDKFATAKNNIFDTESKLIGQSWGEHGVLITNVIDKENKDIHLFFTKLGIEYAVGTFAPNDSMTFTGFDVAYKSNEVHSIYVSAELINDGKSAADSYSVSSTVNTIAHEFQHMINFYQRFVSRNFMNENSILNEMASVMAEDIVMSNLDINKKYTSSRTIGSGSINACAILKVWYDQNPDEYGCSGLGSYAMHNAFGNYLMRKYGTDVLKRMVLSNKKDTDALLDAVTSFNQKTTIKDEVNKFKASYFVGYPVDNYGYPELSNDIVNFDSYSFTKKISNSNYLQIPPVTYKVLPNKLNSFMSATLNEGVKVTGVYNKKLTIPSGVTVTAVVN